MEFLGMFQLDTKPASVVKSDLAAEVFPPHGKSNPPACEYHKNRPIRKAVSVSRDYHHESSKQTKNGPRCATLVCAHGVSVYTPPVRQMRNFPLDIRERLTYSRAMNRLPIQKQVTVLSMMVEGNSIRSTERMTGVHRDTIMRLVERTGSGCGRFLDTQVRGVRATRVQADEIWTYVFKKQARLLSEEQVKGFGDQYVFVALDADSKLVISHLIGRRDAESTYYFMRDLRERVVNRIQLTTDGFKPYVDAVEDTFGADVDYSQLIKVYGQPPQGMSSGPGWYVTAGFVRARPRHITGRPQAVSTSYVERQNLTMRTQMKRFTRLTNGFSKKMENLKASVALHFAHYNFVRVHQTLRVTPAMAANLTGHVWSLEELLEQAAAA
jgi:IS1 family transposase